MISLGKSIDKQIKSHYIKLLYNVNHDSVFQCMVLPEVPLEMVSHHEELFKIKEVLVLRGLYIRTPKQFLASHFNSVRSISVSISQLHIWTHQTKAWVGTALTLQVKLSSGHNTNTQKA